MSKTQAGVVIHAGGRQHQLPLGLGLLAAGLALMIYASLTGAIVVPARVIVFLLGLGAAFAGASRVGKAVAGPGFDLTYWFSISWLVVLIAAAATAPLLPLAQHVEIAKTLDEPSYATPDLFSAHPLGTNNFGLDLLARSIYGARTSLIIALSAVTIGSVIGGTIGLVAGFFRRGIDRAVGIATNSLLAVPPLILLIALASVLEPNTRNVALSLSLLTIPGVIRLARANTLAFSQREFVLAARAMGASRWRLMFRELLPNVFLPVLSLAMVMISVLIVAEASLSFLGLGVEPPQPTWGNMIAEGRGGVLLEHPHVVLVPGVFLFLTVFAFNLVGEKARKRWDPRSGQL